MLQTGFTAVNWGIVSSQSSPSEVHVPARYWLETGFITVNRSIVVAIVVMFVVAVAIVIVLMR